MIFIPVRIILPLLAVLKMDLKNRQRAAEN